MECAKLKPTFQKYDSQMVMGTGITGLLKMGSEITKNRDDLQLSTCIRLASLTKLPCHQQHMHVMQYIIYDS